MEPIDWHIEWIVCFSSLPLFPKIGIILDINAPSYFSKMSFRRVLALKNAIPKRGLEEFLDSTKVAGQDTVYGTLRIFFVKVRSCLESFWAATEKFWGFAQIVVCAVKRTKCSSYWVLWLWIEKCTNAPSRKVTQGEVVNEAPETSIGRKKDWIW